jgi:hypothetical protein
LSSYIGEACELILIYHYALILSALCWELRIIIIIIIIIIITIIIQLKGRWTVSDVEHYKERERHTIRNTVHTFSACYSCISRTIHNMSILIWAVGRLKIISWILYFWRKAVCSFHCGCASIFYFRSSQLCKLGQWIIPDARAKNEMSFLISVLSSTINCPSSSNGKLDDLFLDSKTERSDHFELPSGRMCS